MYGLWVLSWFFGVWIFFFLIYLKLILKFYVVFRFCLMRWFCLCYVLLYNGNIFIVLCFESLYGLWFWRCKLLGIFVLFRNLFLLYYVKWKMRWGILEFFCEKLVNCLLEIRFIICVLLLVELGLLNVVEVGFLLINYWNVIGGGI